MNNVEKNETEVEKDVFEFSEEELGHAKILEDLSLINRSNKHKFTEENRLNKIRELLADSPYQETYTHECYSLWSKVPLSKLPQDVILITSHTDVVGSITECSSKLDNTTGFYTGTYDNQGTNAALVIMMKEHELPENVVLAFTGDEETGRCAGAKQTAKLLRSMGKTPICIALDVTYEGFYQNKLYSLENLTGAEEKLQFVDKIGKAAMDIEPQDANTFCFVAADHKNMPTTIDSAHDSRSTGMYDEAFAYRDINCKAMSICLPCSGNMHSNTGVKVKQPVFEGYVFSLVSLVYELTHTHEQLLEAFKPVRSTLAEKATQVKMPVQQYSSYGGYAYSDYPTSLYRKGTSYYHNFDDDDYDYDAYDEDEEEIAAYNAGFGVDYAGRYVDSYMDDVDDELLMLKAMLSSEAMEYDVDELDYFLSTVSIPTEYMHCFKKDADGNPIEDEEAAIEDFLTEVFKDTHAFELDDEDYEDYE